MQNDTYLRGLKFAAEQRRLQQQYRSWTFISVTGFVLVAYYTKDPVATSIAFCIAAFTAISYASYALKPPAANLQIAAIPRSTIVTASTADAVTRSTAIDPRLAYSANNAFTQNASSNSNIRKASQLDEHHFASENYDLHSPQRIAHSTYMEIQLTNNRALEEQQRQNYSQFYAGANNSSIVGAEYGTRVNESIPEASSPSPQARLNRFQRGNLYTDATAQSINSGSNALTRGLLGGGFSECDAGGDPAQWLSYQTSPVHQSADSPSDSYLTDGTGYNYNINNFAVNDTSDYNSLAAGASSSGTSSLRGTPSYKSPTMLKRMGIDDRQRSGQSMTSPSAVATASVAADTAAAGGNSSNNNRGGAQLSQLAERYLLQQENEVRSAAMDLVQQLSLKTSRARSSGFSDSSSSGEVLTNDDLQKILSVLQLQTDRQLLSNGSAVGRAEILAFGRANSISNSMQQRYDAAVQQYRAAGQEFKAVFGSGGQRRMTTRDARSNSRDSRLVDFFEGDRMEYSSPLGRQQQAGYSRDMYPSASAVVWDNNNTSGNYAGGDKAGAVKSRRYGSRY